jgi:AAA+ superfamily predicted ATPase
MINYEITTEQLQNEILEYIYNNKEFLSYKNNILNCSYSKNRFNKEYKTFISFGEYTFNFNGNDIFIFYKEEGNPEGCDRGVLYFTRLKLVCNKEDCLKEFIKMASMNDKKPEKTSINIYVTNEYGEWYVYNKIPSRNLESVYIDNNIKNKLVDDINLFLKSEDEYNTFGIPYKKTFLLTGPPGMGKTSLIKAICNKFNIDLSILSVSKNFDNSALMHSIKNLEDNTILLIEDIDSLFDKRIGTQDNPSITFSNLINILDGVLYRHATIIFLTTNHPEKLDHALLRIGRIDSIIQINYPSKVNIERLFNDMLIKYYDNNDVIKEEFNKFYGEIKTKKISMSAIVNFLFRHRNNWQENINELLDTNSFIKKTLNQDNSENLYL